MPNERLARHILLAKSTGKWPRGRSRTTWNDCIAWSHLGVGPAEPTWNDCIAWSHLGVGPAEPSEIAVDPEVFQVRLGLLPPAILPRGKAGMKTNEINDMHVV